MGSSGHEAASRQESSRSSTAASGASEPRILLPTAAGAARRLLATLVDMALFTGLSWLLASPLIDAIDWTSALTSYDNAVGALSDRAFVAHASGMLGLWTAAWWCYFVVGWGAAGATPGKWLLRLRIIDHRGRHPIGMTRGALRLIAYMVSSLTLGAGHLLIVLRSDRRALHDILAGTRVVSRGAGRAFSTCVQSPGVSSSAGSRQSAEPGSREPEEPVEPGEAEPRPRSADEEGTIHAGASHDRT